MMIRPENQTLQQEQVALSIEYSSTRRIIRSCSYNMIFYNRYPLCAQRSTTLIIILFVQISQFKGDQWIMLGEPLKGEPTIRMNVKTENGSFAVSTNRMDIAYKTDEDRRINCIIAAAARLNGHVTVIEGGLEQNHVKLRYTTETHKPDVFFVMIQTWKPDPVSFDVDKAENSKYTIVFQPMGDWFNNHDDSPNSNI